MRIFSGFAVVVLGLFLLWLLVPVPSLGPPTVHGNPEADAHPQTGQTREPTMTHDKDRDHLALATFGGGCFWCTEAVFEQLRGVHAVTSGYAGGTTDQPTYQQVCGGTTGHAEVVQVAYDPQEVSYAKLLEVFFQSHDPTTLNRQGADVGTQYRSVILYHDEEQKRLAESACERLNAEGVFDDPVVTEVAPYTTMYPAEDYHQEYFRRNGSQPYCAAVVRPKVEKIRKLFAEQLK